MQQSSPVLTESWKSLAQRVEQQLRTYLELPAECPTQLKAALSYSLMAGGKRLRPVLLLLACDACGGKFEAAMPAACAIEMVHTYSLIHDDLPAMDDDDLRRGKPTNHKIFGEANAILAGDGLLTLAFEVLARDVQPPAIAAACVVDLAHAAGVVGMVGGQSADLAAEHQGHATLEELEQIHRRKTGRLLACSLSMGARIAGAHEDTISSLTEYGKCVGLAFQIADDILDVTGEVTKMGKQVRKDDQQGKLTYPAHCGLEASREKAIELVQRACQCLKPLGERGRRLEELAHFIIEREH